MFFERPTSGHNTILVHVSFRDDSQECDFEEFEELAASAGAAIVATILSKSASPTSSHLLGSGKLAEVKAAVSMHRADLVLVSRRLSSGQERNFRVCFETSVLARYWQDWHPGCIPRGPHCLPFVKTRPLDLNPESKLDVMWIHVSQI